MAPTLSGVCSPGNIVLFLFYPQNGSDGLLTMAANLPLHECTTFGSLQFGLGATGVRRLGFKGRKPLKSLLKALLDTK